MIPHTQLTFHRARAVTVLVTLTGLLLAGLLALPTVESAFAARQDCESSPNADGYRPPDYVLYFADEFNCDRLPEHWQVQGPMGAASYQPPRNGYIQVNSGALQVGVLGKDVSFPYLYLVDDSATSYDIPFAAQRVDWLPNNGDFRLALRVRFRIEAVGDHRISIYADGHTPSYAGPLFYVGADNNEFVEAWRGIIVGADRGNRVVDLGDQGYGDVHAEWITVVIDHLESEDRFEITVDGALLIQAALSTFKGAPYAAVRPDVLYLGSLAYLERATGWIDIEVDWLRVYAPSSTEPAAQKGVRAVIEETAPQPTDPPSVYSAKLPPGPFANTPHWAEDFHGPSMPAYWRLLLDNDPDNTDTLIEDSHAVIRNNGTATAVPVWGIYDDLRQFVPPAALDRTSGLIRQAKAATTKDGLAALADAPAYVDWRPNHGNVRYAWKARQSAEGYGVEVSNGGHVPYFTGAMFYTLLDTTTSGRGQFIFPTCQEKYFWRLHLLPTYAHLGDMETIVTADYVNGTAFFYIDNALIGWWPESDCSLNWYLHGENATSPDLLFFGNPAEDTAGRWSEVSVDWFATFRGLDSPLVDAWLPQPARFEIDWNRRADVEAGEPLTLTIPFSATEPIRWQARLTGEPDWLAVTPLSGTVPLTTPTATVLVSVTRPAAFGIRATVLTLDAETLDGRRVAPISTEIRSVYTVDARLHPTYLPRIIGPAISP